MALAHISSPTKKVLSSIAGHQDTPAMASEQAARSHGNAPKLHAVANDAEKSPANRDSLSQHATVSDQPSWMSRWMKTAVFKALAGLTHGRLIVIDGDERRVFGDASWQASESDQEAIIYVDHANVYRSFVMNGSIGAAEAFIRGEWHSPNLLAVIRVFCKNIDTLNAIQDARSWWNRGARALLHRFNKNSLSGSKRNIAAHYDLGNDFFQLFLDKRMMYSAAVYEAHQEQNVELHLEAAASKKLDVICRKLQLSPNDHLLEIGTGWGGMAIYAAQHYGCKVTTTTISQEQYRHAQQAVLDAGLHDRVTVLLKDYRELDGQYDKLVSIEMIEAVGNEFYRQYFSTCSSLLKPNGLMCIQAITIADQRYKRALSSVDFIQQYIFPGGCLPCNHVIAEHVAQDTDMQITHIQDIGIDYAWTLRAWRMRFEQQLSAIKHLGYSDAFCRMWEYYLCYCEGGFLERTISTVQVLMAKPQALGRVSYSA